MTLAPGTRLGPYEIVSQIGAGGMGEVYRAIDTNLKRATAIKVLPESMASDADRLARFQREAEVLAALNHPNIAAVYGLERSGRTVALVMELVDGPTLADRIAQGAVPVDEALAIARQITEGLEAAHEQGIVHRDLKPANLKLRPDGTVKILDFGLAKALEPAVASSPGTSLSPTITSPAMTQLGMVLGTAAYMSPEQARGKPVDKRADIFAFGCVLFELLTGRRIFDAEDVSLTLAEIMKSEPDWAKLPALPPTVFMHLQRCLIKDARLRLRDIGEMRLALSDAFDIRSFVGPSPAPVTRVRAAWPWMLASAAMAAVAAVALTLWLRPATEPPLPAVVRFEIHAPPGSKIPPGVPAVSPNGRTIAYSMVGPDGTPRLYLHDIGSTNPRVLSGTDNAVHPFWSADGRSLAFVRDRTLKRVDVGNGEIRELAEVTGPWHGSWGKSDDLLFAADGVRRMSAEGGKPTPAVVLDGKAGETAAGFPAFLPDGKRFFVRMERDGASAIHIGSLDSTTRTPILDGVLSAPLATSTPGGRNYLFYLRDEALVAQEFDDRTGKPQGTPRVLVDGIGRMANPPIMPTFSASPGGVIAYQMGGGFTSMVLTWDSRSGTRLSEVRLDLTGQNPTLSPDGLLVAMDAISGDDRDVWVADVTRGVTTRITHGGGTDRNPVWSPDGKRIAFRRGKKIYVTNADGSGTETVLADVDGSPESWSPDDKYLLHRVGPSGALFLWPFGGGGPIPVGSRAGGSRQGQFSPDSRAIAYTSNESGRDEVYVQLTPPASGRVRISANGGSQPRWGRSSGELLFLSADNSMMTVDLRIGEVLSAGTPKKLFVLDVGTVFSNTRYGFDAVHQRFLVPRIQGESIADTPITVVLNWWTEFVRPK